MRLLLIRHAQTPANVDGVLDTRIPGPGLTELGRRQADALADALGSERIAALSVSRMTRTSLTAAPLAERLGVVPVVEPGLEEISVGELEGASDPESLRRFVAVLAAWSEGDAAARVEGGEDWTEFAARFDRAVAATLERARAASGVHAAGGDGSADPAAAVIDRALDGTAAAIVSHGAAIRCWVGGRARNVPPTFAGSHDLGNTGVVEVEGDPDAGFRLLAWEGGPVGGDELEDDAPDPTGEADLAGHDPDR